MGCYDTVKLILQGHLFIKAVFPDSYSEILKGLFDFSENWHEVFQISNPCIMNKGKTYGKLFFFVLKMILFKIIRNHPFSTYAKLLESWYILPPNMHMYVCVPGGKNIKFSENFTHVLQAWIIFLSPDRLPGRKDVRSDKVNFRSHIRQNFFLECQEFVRLLN